MEGRVPEVQPLNTNPWFLYLRNGRRKQNGEGEGEGRRRGSTQEGEGWARQRE